MQALLQNVQLRHAPTLSKGETNKCRQTHHLAAHVNDQEGHRHVGREIDLGIGRACEPTSAREQSCDGQPRDALERRTAAQKQAGSGSGQQASNADCGATRRAGAASVRDPFAIPCSSASARTHAAPDTQAANRQILSDPRPLVEHYQARRITCCASSCGGRSGHGTRRGTWKSLSAQTRCFCGSIDAFSVAY